MDTQPHWVQVLILAAGELAFALVALPLYVLFVLPAHPGGYPGFVPVIAPGADPVLAVVAALGVLAIALAAAIGLPRALGPGVFETEEMNTLIDNFSVLDYVPVFRVVLLDMFGLIISSLAFAAIHLAYWKRPLLLADVFALALLLGALYLFTESLLLCATIHAIYNMAVSVFMKYGIIPRSHPSAAGEA
ncbi:MAG: CPBP family glutamic-type intramembrane protease, partial [Coriobacteriaceae bacterium]|nr:CPBP family glutamic-type intramembrane protease [Coriobacteriaceae bacterium]